MNEKIDKRTNGYKRRQEALLSAPQVIVSMLDRALAAGATASYVLMDSWFTHAPLIGEIASRGLDVIGMVKNDNKRFLVQGRKLSLKELYTAASPVQSKKRGILRSIRTELASGIPVHVVFVRHRTKKNEWLAVLTTGSFPLRGGRDPYLRDPLGHRGLLQVHQVAASFAEGVSRPLL
ncbi:transposase [Weissella paramesenteroides]